MEGARARASANLIPKFFSEKTKFNSKIQKYECCIPHIPTV